MAGLLAKLGFGSEVVEETAEILQADTPALNGADLAVAFFDSRSGGDLHDFLRVGPTRFLFGLLDVAGKRETSTVVLEATQACFRSSAEELFAADELNELDAMVELSRRLNLEIMRSAGGVRSCPAFAGCYNEELGTVCYVNAGHTPGLVRDDEGIVELPATGLPLGCFRWLRRMRALSGWHRMRHLQWSHAEWLRRNRRTRNSAWMESRGSCRRDHCRPRTFRTASWSACRSSCTQSRSITT